MGTEPDEAGSNELHLRVTLDSLSEGVILYAPDGTAAMFNTTARRCAANASTSPRATTSGAPSRCTRCCAVPDWGEQAAARRVRTPAGG
jgi:sensor histidine kinase regulating citrate/malate metabolism